ncbi:Plasmodium exported protein (Pm-fam-a like), unknown function [Plasmodium malariae]|uniref:Uncharacterized protein n=1 Tax=Plasmodium malariae TaxID=5858 RepID=A0A1A8X7X1_PLAMA|nr:Plasmodium exported protein (Pm-fam-a like), unknown function [Plasmodium malariae]
MICTLNNHSGEKCYLCRNLNTRSCRLLSKYKQSKDLCTENFKEDIPNNNVKEKKSISNNVKGANEKYKQSCRSSLYIKEYGKNIDKNKCGLPKTKKYIDFQKKIFKELDYEDYVKNIKTIEYKEYKKLARKKRRIRIALLLLFILILILPILDLSLEKFTDGGLLGLLGLLYSSGTEETGAIGVYGHLVTLLSDGTWGMVYYYRKVIKYENIKLRKKINKN